MTSNTTATQKNGVYYFLGNITSHILHALPLYYELGGTFVVLSQKAKTEVERLYSVPVIALDNKPYQWTHFSWRVTKPYHHYLKIGRDLHRTTDFLNEHARVVLFYEPYDFAPEVQLVRPKTVFLTHGNMLKEYIGQANRLKILQQYDYMAAIGPYLKQRFIEEYGIDPSRLVDIGLARTDELVAAAGKVTVSTDMATQLAIDPTQQVISYLPTFWGASSIYTIGKQIVRDFPENYTLLFRPHPQTPRKLLRDYERLIATRPHIRYVPEGAFSAVGLLDVFLASSAIIGDVSSVMLDALLLKKPLLFAFDQGSHQQSTNSYSSVKAILDQSQKITLANSARLPQLVQAALKQGIDERVWQNAIAHNFFHADGTSVAAIMQFVTSL